MSRDRLSGPQRVRIITLYFAHDAHGNAGFISKWHERLDECATSDERNEIERLMGAVCQQVYGVMCRDMRAEVVC